MLSSQTFLPKSSRVGVARAWILLIIAFVAFFVLLPKYQPEFVGFRWVFGVLVLAWTLFFKLPFSIVVNPQSKTLVYTYFNAWGTKHSIVVDLTTAGGYYELEQTGKTAAGWRLVLYNGNYYHNRISVKENNSSGFTKAQLDEIVSLVHACKG